MHHGMEERLVVEVGAVANAGLVGASILRIGWR